MRILHTADLHLGRQFNGLSLEHDHAAILAQIEAVVLDRKPEVLVIAGDIFDRASPPASAVRQFNDFVSRLVSRTGVSIAMIGPVDAAIVWIEGIPPMRTANHSWLGMSSMRVFCLGS